MIFLDTNIWIELSGAKTPETEHEKRQARSSTQLMASILEKKEKVITCKEQILEIINAVQKVKLQEANRNRKRCSLKGLGNVKSFRDVDEFHQFQEICGTIIGDIVHFASIKDFGDFDLAYMHEIINRLNLADINDCIYYDYCMKNNVDLYSFDNDLKKLGDHKKLHII